MKPFIIEITGIAASDDEIHAMLAAVKPSRDGIVDALKAAGATEVHARSTSVRKNGSRAAKGA